MTCHLCNWILQCLLHFPFSNHSYPPPPPPKLPWLTVMNLWLEPHKRLVSGWKITLDREAMDRGKVESKHQFTSLSLLYSKLHSPNSWSCLYFYRDDPSLKCFNKLISLPYSCILLTPCIQKEPPTLSSFMGVNMLSNFSIDAFRARRWIRDRHSRCYSDVTQM